MDRNWLSLLAQPGTLLFERELGLKSAVYVLGASDKAVVGLAVKAKVHGGQRYLEMASAPIGEPIWKYVFINDLTKNYLVQETRCIPPASCKAQRTDGDPLGVLIGVPGDAVVPMLKYAAGFAFRGMTCEFMKKLVHELHVDVHPIPTLEKELTLCLLRACKPGLSEAEYLDILPLRHANASKFLCTIDKEIAAAAADLLGDSGTAEVTKEIEEYTKAVKAAKSLLPKPKAGAGGPGVAGKKKKNSQSRMHMRSPRLRSTSLQDRFSRWKPIGIAGGRSLTTAWNHHTRPVDLLMKRAWQAAVRPFSKCSGGPGMSTCGRLATSALGICRRRCFSHPWLDLVLWG